MNWAWRLRGLLDLMVGGVGLRRGRKDPEWPARGESLDFWRVESIVPNRLLRLRAEMRLPGRAWLQFEIADEGDECVLRQTAVFKPRGLSGLLYWYTLYPVHVLIFRGMLRRMGELALSAANREVRDETFAFASRRRRLLR
jgi:hypothetical protein